MSVPDSAAGLPRWRNLTRELTDPTSPIRDFFEDYFPKPNRRAVQHHYRTTTGPLLLPATPGVNGGTVGTAFDLWVQLQLTPRPPLDLAQIGAEFTSALLGRTLTALLNTLAPQPTAPNGRATWPWTTAPVPAEQLLRTAWVLALFVEVYRGGLSAGSPLSTINPRWRRRIDLLSLPTASQIGALRDITDLAEHQLLGPLRHRPTTAVLGPTFPLSARMNADADLLLGTTLYELKTNQGQKKADGTRECTLTLATLLQVLSYVLHDADDTHHIDTISLYQARYGHVTTWSVDDLMAELAGHPLHLGDLRSEWSDLVHNGTNTRP